MDLGAVGEEVEVEEEGRYRCVSSRPRCGGTVLMMELDALREDVESFASHSTCQVFDEGSFPRGDYCLD